MAKHNLLPLSEMRSMHPAMVDRAESQARFVTEKRPNWGINLSSGGSVDGVVTKAEVIGFAETRCYREILFEITIDCDNSDSKIPGAPKTLERKFKVKRLPRV